MLYFVFVFVFATEISCSGHTCRNRHIERSDISGKCLLWLEERILFLLICMIASPFNLELVEITLVGEVRKYQYCRLQLGLHIRVCVVYCRRLYRNGVM